MNLIEKYINSIIKYKFSLKLSLQHPIKKFMKQLKRNIQKIKNIT